MAISYKSLHNEVLQDIDNMKNEQLQQFKRVINCILQLKKNKHNFTIQKYYKVLHVLQGLLYEYNDNIQFFQNWYNRELKEV